MANETQKLAELQELDIRIRRLQREEQDIPLRQKQIEAGNQGRTDAVKAGKAAHAARQSEAKKIELDVEAEQAKIRKLREQQLLLKTNREFKAMEDEIRQIQNRIAKLEDDELRVLGLVEEESRQVVGLKAELDRAAEQAKIEIAALGRRSAEIRDELAGLLKERSEKAEKVDARWLRRYESILNNKGDRALVKVEHGVCGGCNMTLAPHVIHDARRGDLMVDCSFCGRLLY